MRSPNKGIFKLPKGIFVAPVAVCTKALTCPGASALFPVNLAEISQKGKQNGWVLVVPDVEMTESMEMSWHWVTCQQDSSWSLSYLYPSQFPVLSHSEQLVLTHLLPTHPSQFPALSHSEQLVLTHLLLLVSTWHSTISPNTSKRFFSSRELMSLERFRMYTTWPSPCSRRRVERKPVIILMESLSRSG